MKMPKSLLVGMAALPWASAFGTMPHTKSSDPLAGLGDVNTAGETATAQNQAYIMIQGTSTSPLSGAQVCAAQPNQNDPTITGCYRHITGSGSCKAAAAWLQDEKGWASPRGDWLDLPTADSTTSPADCFAIKGSTFPFSFNDGTPNTAPYGTAPWGKVRWVCEFFCPPTDDTTIGAKCYAAGQREYSNPSCQEAADEAGMCRKPGYTYSDVEWTGDDNEGSAACIAARDACLAKSCTWA